MIIFLVPQFQEMFADMHLSLPPATTIALKIGARPMLIIVMPLVVAIVVFLLIRFWIRSTEHGRVTWAQTVYSMPLIGSLIRSARMAAFVDLLALLVDYSVPLPEAFKLAGDASSDPIIAAQARGVRQRLDQGRTLGDALRDHDVLPEWVAWMTAAGERGGALGPTLHQVATVYRRNAEGRAGVLKNVLPSILIIATAVVLGGVFITTMVLPLIKLVEGLSK
jgi:type II secretory pathway component PulF